jgi:2-haloacid dehalogenase
VHSRRKFLKGLPATALILPPGHSRGPARIKAVVFDGLAIFDPHIVFSLLDDMFPNDSAALANLWRALQFEYMWLRSLSHRYAEFLSVAADALVFAANALKLQVTAANRSRVMDAWLKLPCWPDVVDSLHGLRDAGLRIGFLSNMSEKMLAAGMRNGGLQGLFDHALSTDRVRAYKPDPRAYRMAIDVFRLRREEIAFVAAAGWDAAGASHFGYHTFWVNRQHQPAEELGANEFAIGATLSDLIVHLRAGNHL